MKNDKINSEKAFKQIQQKIIKKSKKKDKNQTLLSLNMNYRKNSFLEELKKNDKQSRYRNK